MSEDQIKEGWISSNNQRPPFKILVETFTPFGYSDKAMFHENQNDGYNFKNESPMNVHLIDDFEREIVWRRIKDYTVEHITIQNITL